jgi:hypothetical protein
LKEALEQVKGELIRLILARDTRHGQRAQLIRLSTITMVEGVGRSGYSITLDLAREHRIFHVGDAR